MKYIIICLFLGFFPLFARDLSFQCAPWKLTVSDQNGAWKNLQYKNFELLSNSAGVQTVNLNTARLHVSSDFQDNSHGEAAGDAVRALVSGEGVKSNIVKLKKHTFNHEQRKLILEYQFGPWNLQEEITLGTKKNPNRIKREARFVANALSELKFNGFQFMLFLPLKGRYYFPATFFMDYWWREDNRPAAPKLDKTRCKGDLSDLSGSGNDRIKFIILAPKKNLSLILFSDSRIDGSFVRVKRTRSQIQATWNIGAKGWAYRGKVQQLAGCYLEVVEKDEDRALRENCPAMLTDLGYIPPKDRPEWVKSAIIYGLENEPFSGEVLRDVTRSLMPRMKYLGTNTAWYRPSEASTGRYTPIDYRLIEPKIGTNEEYRNINETMHQNGIRVLQDLVPHGGSQLGFLLRGQSISMMGFTEKGAVLNGWAADFNDPRWKQYMHDICLYYTKDLKTDGFRIDAIYGTKTLTNWRKENWPSQPPPIAIPGADHIHVGKVLPVFWDQSMKLDGGKLPALAYDRGSLASSYGGLAMNQAMRSGAREGNREAAVLLESGELPFTAAGDLHYDRDIQSCWFKMRYLSPAEFVEGLRTWLDEEQYVDAPGTIRMRYMETGVGESWNYRRWYGLEGDKAIRAMCTYIHGVPMVYEMHTFGEGSYLKRLFLLRKNLSALNFGTADYLAVKSSSKEVFTVLRKDEKNVVATAINFSPEAVETELTLSSDFYGNLFDLFSGKSLGKFRNGKLKVSIPPFGNVVIAPFEKLPAWAAAEEKSSLKVQEGKISLEKTKEFFLVGNNARQLKISRQNGQIIFFGIPGKDNLVTGDLLKRGNSFGGKVKVFASEKNDCVMITAEGENWKIVYTAFVENLKISASGKIPLKLALSFPKAVDWELDSFEGMLSDQVPEAIRKSNVFYQNGKVRDLVDWRKVWHSTQIPLDWNRPEIRVFSSEGNVTLSVAETTAQQALYHGADGKPLLRYIADFGGNEKNLTLTLNYGAVHEKSLFGKKVLIGKTLTVSNASSAWRISNKFYSVDLLRSNGVIRELSVQTQNGKISVLRNQNITASKNMFRNMPYAAASMDPGTTVKIERGDGKLHLQFRGEIRSAYAMSGNRLELQTDYYFDDTPEIRCEYTFVSSIGIKGKNELLFSAEKERFPKYLKYKAFCASDTGTVSDISKAKNLRLSFLKDLNLIPRKEYRFAVVYRTDGKNPETGKLLCGKELKLKNDFGFEERTKVHSLAQKKELLLFEPDFSSLLPWTLRYNAYAAPGIGKGNSAGIYMSWPNPEFRQEIMGSSLAKGRYRISFDLKSRLIDVPRIRKWSDKLLTVHPHLRKSTPISLTLEYCMKDGTLKKISRNWEVEKIHNWKKLSMELELNEDVYAPAVKIGATPEYAGELFLDNLNIEKITK